MVLLPVFNKLLCSLFQKNYFCCVVFTVSFSLLLRRSIVSNCRSRSFPSMDGRFCGTAAVLPCTIRLIWDTPGQYLLHQFIRFFFLPPASEGWGRYCFHRCVSVHWRRGSPVPGSFPGLWSQILSAGTVVPGSFPGLWSQILSQGVPQFQVLSQVSGPKSFPGWGYHSPRWPGLSRVGVPQSQPGCTSPSWGYYPREDSGTLQLGLGCPLAGT